MGLYVLSLGYLEQLFVSSQAPSTLSIDLSTFPRFHLLFNVVSAVLEHFFHSFPFLLLSKGIQQSKRVHSHSGTHSRLLQRLLAHGVGAGLAHHRHGYQPQGGREGQSTNVYARTHLHFCVPFSHHQ